MFDIF